MMTSTLSIRYLPGAFHAKSDGWVTWDDVVRLFTSESFYIGKLNNNAQSPQRGTVL